MENCHRARHAFRCTLLLLSLLLAACGGQRKQPFVIGVVNESAVNDLLYGGFKAGLAGLGYPEGERVRFIFGGYTGKEAADVDREITRLMAQKPDALLVMGGSGITSAARLLKGKTLPVVFAPINSNDMHLIIDDIRHPGGNMTGVQSVNDMGKIMEWMKQICPGTEYLLIPRDPSTMSRLVDYSFFPAAVERAGMRARVRDMRFPADMNAVIPALPAGSAIFLVPTIQSIAGFIATANAHGVPVFSSMPDHAKEGALFTLALDHDAVGRQAAHMMARVIQGIRPGEIPVETADPAAVLNLRAAAALGLRIPDDILDQMDAVIR